MTCIMPKCNFKRHNGYEVCRTHQRHTKGIGKLKCNVCHKPQRVHSLGYFEHPHEAQFATLAKMIGPSK